MYNGSYKNNFTDNQQHFQSSYHLREKDKGLRLIELLIAFCKKPLGRNGTTSINGTCRCSIHEAG